jgi:transposase
VFPNVVLSDREAQKVETHVSVTLLLSL